MNLLRFPVTIDEAYEVVDPRTKKGKEYGFYTPKKWHIIEKQTHKNLSAHLKMKKVHKEQ